MGVCDGCKYYATCGEKNRTEDCVGKVVETMETKTFGDYRDTIKVLATNGEYTLIEYIKGEDTEWNVALHYNAEERNWSAGNYCYSIESAFETYLRKVNSKMVKKLNSHEEFVEGMIEWFDNHELDDYQAEKMRDLIPEEFWARIGCEEKPKFKVYEVEIERRQTVTVTVAVPVDKNGNETEDACDLAQQHIDELSDRDWDTESDYDYDYDENCIEDNPIDSDTVQENYDVINTSTLED